MLSLHTTKQNSALMLMSERGGPLLVKHQLCTKMDLKNQLALVEHTAQPMNSIFTE